MPGDTSLPSKLGQGGAASLLPASGRVAGAKLVLRDAAGILEASTDERPSMKRRLIVWAVMAALPLVLRYATKRMRA